MMTRPLPSGLERGTPDIPAAAREIVALQLEASDAAEALETVKGLREPWERFVSTLRPIVQASEGKPWPINDPLLRPRVLLADHDRLDLKTRAGNLAVITDPLAQLLRMSFLQPHDGLYHVIGGREGSTFLHAIDPDRFEMVVAESGGILNEGERRLIAQRDRAQRQAGFLQEQLNGERADQLARLEREHWSFKGLWHRLTASALGKTVTWAVVSLATAILALAVPALVKVASSVWTLFRLRTGL